MIILLPAVCGPNLGDCDCFGTAFKIINHRHMQQHSELKKTNFSSSIFEF